MILVIHLHHNACHVSWRLAQWNAGGIVVRPGNTRQIAVGYRYGWHGDNEMVGRRRDIEDKIAAVIIDRPCACDSRVLNEYIIRRVILFENAQIRGAYRKSGARGVVQSGTGWSGEKHTAWRGSIPVIPCAKGRRKSVDGDWITYCWHKHLAKLARIGVEQEAKIACEFSPEAHSVEASGGLRDAGWVDEIDQAVGCTNIDNGCPCDEVRCGFNCVNLVGDSQQPDVHLSASDGEVGESRTGKTAGRDIQRQADIC